MDALRGTQLNRSRLTVMRTLRKGAPNETMHLSDAQLREIVLFSERQGEALGIRSEKAHAKWAYLNLVTKGKLVEQDGVLDYMRDGRDRPDKKVELMLRSVVILSKHEAGKIG